MRLFSLLTTVYTVALSFYPDPTLYASGVHYELPAVIEWTIKLAKVAKFLVH